MTCWGHGQEGCAGRGHAPNKGSARVDVAVCICKLCDSNLVGTASSSTALRCALLCVKHSVSHLLKHLGQLDITITDQQPRIFQRPTTGIAPYVRLGASTSTASKASATPAWLRVESRCCKAGSPRNTCNRQAWTTCAGRRAVEGALFEECMRSVLG